MAPIFADPIAWSREHGGAYPCSHRREMTVELCDHTVYLTVEGTSAAFVARMCPECAARLDGLLVELHGAAP